MAKAVFFDIDGTLFSLEHGILQSTRKALELLKQTDTIVAICTGRCRVMMEPELEKIGFPVYICGAGTYVEYNGEILYNEIIPEAMTDEVVRLCKEANVFCVLEGPEWIYFDYALIDNPTCMAFGEHMKRHMGDVLVPYVEGKSIANKYSIFLEPDSDISNLMPFLQENFDIIRHGDDLFMEVLPKGHSKATGIALLIEKLGIKKEDTYAFGDSCNDLEMLAYVEYGIAMGNSNPMVLQNAKYKTRDMDQEGIAWGLQQFGLLPKDAVIKE